MKKFVYFLIFTLCFCTVFVKDSKAQGRNSVTGFVFGESRTPVPNINVELLDDMYGTRGRMQTNGSGMFSFRGLANGGYIIRVLTSGTNYEEQTQSISLVPVSAVRGSGSISEQVDIYLKVRKRKTNGQLAAPGVVFVQETPENAKKMYESGLSELAEKKEESGLAKIKQSIEIFPDYFMALDRLGNEYLARGFYLPASALFTKAISVNPKSFSSNFGLGLAFYRLNELDEAIKQFKNSITISSDSINAHLWLGIAQHNKNNLSDALSSMLEADKLSEGKAAEVHFQLARVYKDQKKYRKAAEELELYLKYTPEAKNADETKRIIETKQIIKKLKEKQ